VDEVVYDIVLCNVYVFLRHKTQILILHFSDIQQEAAGPIIIINGYLEAGLMASISVQHIYYGHELQQELY